MYGTGLCGEFLEHVIGLIRSLDMLLSYGSYSAAMYNLPRSS
jgi:hypothetical protein